MVNSREKGKAGEREFAEFLRTQGFTNCRRGVQYQGGPESPDVVGLVGVHIEVKRTEKFRLYPALTQAEAEKKPEETAIVAHRSNGRPWVVCLKAEDFCRILEKLNGQP